MAEFSAICPPPPFGLGLASVVSGRSGLWGRGPLGCAVGLGGFRPLGSSPVLGLFGWISDFAGWGLGVGGDSVARLSRRLSTRYS